MSIGPFENLAGSEQSPKLCRASNAALVQSVNSKRSQRLVPRAQVAIASEYDTLEMRHLPPGERLLTFCMQTTIDKSGSFVASQFAGALGIRAAGRSGHSGPAITISHQTGDRCPRSGRTISRDAQASRSQPPSTMDGSGPPTRRTGAGGTPFAAAIGEENARGQAILRG